jgi:hypothetical protein
MQDDPFVGTWKLNPVRCEFDPKHRPAAATMVFELDGEHYVMKAEGLTQEGEKVAERPQRFIPDGREHPVPDFPGLKAITTRPDGNTLQGEVRREDGSVAGGAVYSVSADGKILSVTNFGWDSQLRQFKQKTVWERV